jgi:hypothetical protein
MKTLRDKRVNLRISQAELNELDKLVFRLNYTPKSKRYSRTDAIVLAINFCNGKLTSEEELI